MTSRNEKYFEEINEQLDFLKQELSHIRMERHRLIEEEEKRLSKLISDEMKKISKLVNNSLREISEQTSEQLYRLHREGEKVHGAAKEKAAETIQTMEKQAENKLVSTVQKKIEKETGRIKDELVEMEKKAITDDLTRIYNRRYFEPRMKVEMGIARRSRSSMSIIIFDIDSFKRINDTYGHPAGDFILSELASILSKNLRKEEIPVRYGGEEFVVILPGIHKNQALETARRLRKKIEEHPIYWEGKNLSITVSGGVACYPEDAREFSKLIKQADDRLLKAKKSGKNTVIAK
ncbi:MAG: GGDEF domain-containing protein [Elusimicrobiota bacterium]